jgi:hypothetical protein
MFDATQDIATGSVPPEPAFHALRDFAGQHSEAMFDAARLLGGKAGLRLAQEVIDRLDKEPSFSGGTYRQLGQLLDLFTLRHVHEPERIEAACFAMIDPCDPFVEEICLLADRLGDLVAEAHRASAKDDATVLRRRSVA